MKIKAPDRALAALALLARLGTVLTMEMLQASLKIRFKGDVLEKSLALVDRMVSVDIV
jgi:hypothetical protein